MCTNCNNKRTEFQELLKNHSIKKKKQVEAMKEIDRLQYIKQLKLKDKGK